jgi:hypothetical protein
LAEVRRLSTPAIPDGQLSGIWEGVRRRIINWETARRKPEHSDEKIRNRVATQIAPFLGNAAARKVLEPIHGDNQRFLAGAEGVLGEFFGRGAAADLVSRVVENAIVNI